MEMVAQQRNQRDEHLASGEVDKIDQSKYSKETHLVRRERNGLRRHAEFARRPTRDLVERRPEVISLCSAFQDYMMTKNSALSTNATTSDRLTTVLSYGVLLLLIYLVFRIYEPFLAALGWAAILVIFFYPMHDRLARKFSASRAAVFSTLVVTFLLIVPAILVTTLFVREAVSISRGVQHSIVEQHSPMLAKTWA